MRKCYLCRLTKNSIYSHRNQSDGVKEIVSMQLKDFSTFFGIVTKMVKSIPRWYSRGFTKLESYCYNVMEACRRGSQLIWKGWSNITPHCTSVHRTVMLWLVLLTKTGLYIRNYGFVAILVKFTVRFCRRRQALKMNAKELLSSVVLLKTLFENIGWITRFLIAVSQKRRHHYKYYFIGLLKNRITQCLRITEYEEKNKDVRTSRNPNMQRYEIGVMQHLCRSQKEPCSDVSLLCQSYCKDAEEK